MPTCSIFCEFLSLFVCSKFFKVKIMHKNLEETENLKCSCCPYGFHIDVDFVKFSEEQLSVKKSDKIVKTIYSPRNRLFSSNRTSLNSIIMKGYSEKCTEEQRPDEFKNSRVKTPVKRESLYIQQKILDLKACDRKSNKEIYGEGLLSAIQEFEDFIAKTWGTKRPGLKQKKIVSIQENVDVKNLFEGKSNDETKRPSTAPADACCLCQRKCPCKTSTSASTLTCYEELENARCTTTGVNTEFTPNKSIATNTVVESYPSPRTEPLSKLTIRIQNPTNQQPDCGSGEGNASNPIHTTEEMKSEDPGSTSSLEELVESKEAESKNNIKFPTADMKAALKIMNDALLHGRTGREVTASMAVVLKEWFETVGTQTSNVSDTTNYLSSFERYSPQLLRYMVNIPDTNGITALHYAVSYGNFQIVSKLLDTKVMDPNKANKAGYTSIMLASLAEIKTKSHEQIIRKLIDLGDVNVKAAQHGQTALMLAASNGRSRMVKLLLEAGADVNVQDEDGSTALMCAVEHGHADIVQCLLAHPGCDPNITDDDGLTALNVAMEANQKDIAVMLYAHMYFVKTPSLPSTPTADSLLLAKRSRSTTEVSLGQSNNDRTSASRKDSQFMARKQQSSIN